MSTITNHHLSLGTNAEGEITFLKYDSHNLLHDGQKDWAKIYPMIWPNTSYSRQFVLEGKNYPLPKHGFWKKLAWAETVDAVKHTIILTARHVASEIYPFTISINHEIKVNEHSVVIATTFRNLSKVTAYFQFGHHPAFAIDEKSHLLSKAHPQAIGLDGKLGASLIPMDYFKKMPFGTDYDTLVFKNNTLNEARFEANGFEISVVAPDFNSMQIWKPAAASFICIEPWQGYNDDEYSYPPEAKNKTEIISLPSGKSLTKKVTIKIRPVTGAV